MVLRRAFMSAKAVRGHLLTTYLACGAYMGDIIRLIKVEKLTT